MGKKAKVKDFLATVYQAGQSNAAQTPAGGWNGTVQTPPTQVAPQGLSELDRLLDRQIAGLFMIKISGGRKRQKTKILITSMDDGSSIGWDTCSAVNASTKSKDGILLNKSDDAIDNFNLTGVNGGSAKLIGTFLWLVPLLEAWVPIYSEPGVPTGEYEKWDDAWMATGDVGSSILIDNDNDDQNNIRVLSSDGMKSMGVVLRCGVGPENKDFLMCKKTGVLIPVHSENGLLVIKTRRQSPSTYSNNPFIRDWV